jgi:hypothetical protein
MAERHTTQIEPQFDPNNSPSTLGTIGAIEYRVGRHSLEYQGHDEQVDIAHVRREGRKTIGAGIAVALAFLAVGSVAKASGETLAHHHETPAPLAAGPHHRHDAHR